MKRIRYTTPRLDVLFDPTPDVVAAHLANSPWLEWDRSPNAEACLDWASRTKIDDNLKFTETLGGNCTYYLYCDDPCIIIKQPEPGCFFLTWMKEGEQLVPYNGGDLKEFTLSHCGGNDFHIPLACLTDLVATVAIVRAFIESQSRDNCVNWSSWFDLDLPEEWF